MHLRTMLGIALLAGLVGFAAGAQFGGRGIDQKRNPAVVTASEQKGAAEERKILYWQHPDGAPDYAPASKKTADGRAYLPVYEEQEPAIGGTAPKPAGKGKVLYYRNPMGLADTSPVPKKDWMGMDYIPVYEGEAQEAGTVKVSLDRAQRAGVRSEAAALRVLARPVRAPGIVKPDERTLRSVSLRADGFIEKLFVNATGQPVKAGEPMFNVYSPQMVAVQVDYRNAKRASASDGRMDQGALQRLRNLGVPEAVIEQLKSNAEPRMLIGWPAPMSGIVMTKTVVEGQMARAGEELFRLADLASVWVIADVPEQDLGLVGIDAPAVLHFRAFPGERFVGKVGFILHELDPATRTAKVRIEVQNLDYRLKHEMFADVEIGAAEGSAAVLTVPISAVIDSGNRQIVLVDRGEGRFQPRPVTLGRRGDGLVEIRDGLKAGEQVVTAATFLIDAESNLKAALQAFTASTTDGGKP